MPSARQRVVLDASVLVSVVNSDDEFHLPCYQYFRESDDAGTIWVVPGLIVFEFEATQSRRYREKGRDAVYRHAPLYDRNTELCQVTREFLQRVGELNLYDVFARLRGADLLYACIAKIEGIPLVTHDLAFKAFASEIEMIDPVLVNGHLTAHWSGP